MLPWGCAAAAPVRGRAGGGASRQANQQAVGRGPGASGQCICLGCRVTRSYSPHRTEGGSSSSSSSSSSRAPSGAAVPQCIQGVHAAICYEGCSSPAAHYRGRSRPLTHLVGHPQGLTDVQDGCVALAPTRRHIVGREVAAGHTRRLGDLAHGCREGRGGHSGNGVISAT